MSIARLDDGPQAQLLILDGIRLVNHHMLPPHQVGVGLARPNRKGSSYGGQVCDPIHAQQLYGVRGACLQVPHDHPDEFRGLGAGFKKFLGAKAPLEIASVSK